MKRNRMDHPFPTNGELIFAILAVLAFTLWTGYSVLGWFA